MEMWIKCLIFSLVISLSVQRSVIVVEERKSEEIQEESDENPGNLTILVRNSDPSNCSCDSRYHAYYEAKGCRPAHYDSCGCPMKYACDNINEILDDRVCHYQGANYEPGARIVTKNPCEQCYCSEEYMIVCTLEQCPTTPSSSLDNCHDIYEVDQCCPTNTTCFDDNEGKNEKSGLACVYEGNTYPLGARMYSKDDPCEVCLCTEDWINSNGTSSSCYMTHCILEKYKTLLLKGCAPVYQDDTCCPTDFFCAPDEEFFRDTQTIEPDVDLKCSFFGKNYHVGDSVSISQEDGCLSCTCQVPPDLTCVQQTCKPNPNEETCYPYYTSGGGCCPHYECLMSDGNHETVSGRLQPLSKREMEDEEPIVPGANLETGCAEVQCDGNAICMLYLVNCGNRTCLPLPTCIQTNVNCSVPVCGEGCVVTELDSSNCLSCACGADIENRNEPLKCGLPNCSGQNCLIKSGVDGCPSCVCAGPCHELHCREGCNVVTEIEGRCPKCVCEDETEGCPTPVCEHEGCTIEPLPNGCPTCVCRSGNTGRELEDNVGGNQNPNQGQQQQQQVGQSNMGYEEGYSPPVGTGGDYDDTIVFMDGTSQQNSNMRKKRVQNEDYYDDNIESKQSPNILLGPSSNFPHTELGTEEEGENSEEFELKPIRRNQWIELEP